MQADSELATYVFEARAYGGSQNPNINCLHSVESPLRGGYARTLLGPAWFGGPKAGTSTHYLVDPVDTGQGVPEGRVAYAVGRGNARVIHTEQAGYARFSRAEWLTPDGLAQLDRIARLWADINRRRPLIQLRWLSDAELLAAWNNPGSPGGCAFHQQFMRVIGGTTHHDPFQRSSGTADYPMDLLMAKAIGYRTGNQPTKEWDELATKEEISALVDARLKAVMPGVINDAVANVLRAGEFRLSLANITKGRQEDVFRATTDVLHSPEFKGWQEVTRRAAAVILEEEPEPEQKTHTVEPGDTLSKIAARFGVTVDDIVAWNGITDPNSITVGQVLKVSAPK